ncbi:MAG: hypothetical protein ACLS89_00175 [Collinsella sp.]
MRLIASDLSDGSSVVDRYAPLNTGYSYRVAAYGTSGASRATEHPGSIKTPYCFVYYGDGLMAAQFDPTEQRNLERANRTLVRYAGRSHPSIRRGRHQRHPSADRARHGRGGGARLRGPHPLPAPSSRAWPVTCSTSPPT